jgi:hypothetical protein
MSRGDNPPLSVLVLNTHFDHVGVAARCESAKMILKKIDACRRNNEPGMLIFVRLARILLTLCTLT